MNTNDLLRLYTRDLNTLKTEIEAYTNEKNLWLTTNEVKNSAGNLCLHLVGNLNTFIGAALGNTGYIRQRDLEFSLKDVPRKELITQVEEVTQIVTNTVKTLTEADLQKEYKRRVSEDFMTTKFFLMYLTVHLAYHLGQINYHRRLLDK